MDTVRVKSVLKLTPQKHHTYLDKGHEHAKNDTILKLDGLQRCTKLQGMHIIYKINLRPFDLHGDAHLGDDTTNFSVPISTIMVPQPAVSF